MTLIGKYLRVSGKVLYNLKHESLGVFTRRWNKKVFLPYAEIVFDSKCLRDIANYLDKK